MSTLPLTSLSSNAIAGPSSGAQRNGTGGMPQTPRGFDVVEAYRKAVQADRLPHPIAAIIALVELMEASTASTVTGLASELLAGRKQLVDTQLSLGVRAGCQLWERFFALSGGGEVMNDFPAYKKALMAQGRSFCTVTAPQCREKIATLAVDFIQDDSTILTHSCSRVVVSTILKAHKQHKRMRVYVTEAKPTNLGMKTHQILTDAGVPCIVVLDSAVAYIMERVDMVLVGSEAVVESGGLVSSIGTYQTALVAKAMRKPVYALCESYKFLRHYPLSQTDIPLAPLSTGGSAPRPQIPLSFPSGTAAYAGPVSAQAHTRQTTTSSDSEAGGKEMTNDQLVMNPLVDVTDPELIDFIITDLGAPLTPAAVSQYLVAQFSA